MRPERSTSPLGNRPMIAFDVTDLPEPDSPTMPRVLPRCRESEMPFTACTTPRRVPNPTWRSCTLSSSPPRLAPTTPSAGAVITCRSFTFSSCSLRSQRTLADVELLAHPVADEVERHHRERDRDRRDED